MQHENPLEGSARKPAAPARHIPGAETRAPDGPYRSSPVFTAETLPQALQHEHRTKRGVWGVIRILDGSLRYWSENAEVPELLTPERPRLVRPDEPHRVEVIGPVTMRVDFYDHEPPEASSWIS